MSGRDLVVFDTSKVFIKNIQREQQGVSLMKILLADKLSQTAITELEKLGATVTNQPDAKAEKLPDIIKDHTILVVRSTKVTAETIQAAPNLTLIIRAGAGVNTIDLKTASNRGIHVANCPGKNTAAVAELALGLLIAADRRIVDATNDLRDGKWRKKEYGKSSGLKDRTLGIVGLGAIGKALAIRAGGLGMNIIAWSRSLTPEFAKELGIKYCDSINEIAEKSDAISVHLASKAETHHIIEKTFFNKMKDHAIFINTSRGEVVDSSALQDAVKSKKLRVGMDVFETEPDSGEASFTQTNLSKIISCTPHIGASTYQAAEAVASEVIRIVEQYKNTGKPANVVNIRAKSITETTFAVRHYNRVGVLAFVLDELRSDNVNIEEMENTIFDGSKAALCTLKLDDCPTEAQIDKIRKNDAIIQVVLV